MNSADSVSYVERDLMLACLAESASNRKEEIQRLLRAPIRWENLFALAEHHGVQPLLYQALANVESGVPSEAMRVLQRTYQTNLHKAMLLARELIEIVDHLSAKGIEVLPYKGLALAEMIYGDLALRPTSDIDLLIRAKDLPGIRQAVAELGYKPHLSFSAAEERAYVKSGYECAFDGPAGPNLLEVQWAIQPRFYAVDFDVEQLFSRAAAIEVAGHPMKTPCAEDLFVVLPVHAAKHAWARLMWLCDLARIMSLPNLDWRAIGARARDLGVVRILRVSLLLANRMLKTAIPPAAEAGLPSDADAATLAKEIEESVKNDATYDVESAEYFRLMLRLRENARDRMKFLTRLVFTSGPSEWEAVRLPAALFPLYRVVRLGRLARRFMKA
jgi:hypothetical protein